MWSELKLDDEDLEDKVVKFYDCQKAMNQHYEENLTPEVIIDTLLKKQPLNIRAFYYDDGVTKLSLGFKMLNTGELRLITTGCAAHADLAAAVAIAQAKMIEVIGEYGKASAFAVRSKDNYPAGEDYYSMFASEETCLANGFSSVETSNWESSRPVTWWYI